MSEDKENMGDKLKRSVTFKIHGPKNPFKGNPFKKKEE